MDNDQLELSREESLRIINSMVRAAQGAVAHNGFDFIFWGWLLVAASVGHLVFLSLGTSFDPGVVYFLMPLGGVYVWLHHRNEEKQEQVKTHIDSMLMYVWGSFGAMMLFGIYFAAAANLSPIPFILLFVGTATFISGGAMKFKPLIWGGVMFWVSSVIAFNVNLSGQLVVQGLSMIIGYLVPGYMLLRNYRRANVHRA